MSLKKTTNRSKNLVQVQQHVPVKEAENKVDLTDDNMSTGEANGIILLTIKGQTWVIIQVNFKWM